jgi:hypothetical protein
LKVKCSSSIEIGRIPPKLKMLTGTYILQTIRTKMYGDEDAKCQLCKVEPQALGYTFSTQNQVCSIYVPVNIFSFGGILPIPIDDEHLTFNSGCIFPGR